jgi:hypothetical protein
MSFWKNAKQTAIMGRLIDEKKYEQVFREVESGFRRDGLWAKALHKSRGNEQRAKALYIKYRVQSLNDEAVIAEALSEEIEQRPVITAVKAIDGYDEDGYTPLMKAVKAMDVELVVAMLEKGANPRIADGNFGTSTALSMAELLLKRATTEETQKGYQRIIDILEPVS